MHNDISFTPEDAALITYCLDPDRRTTSKDTKNGGLSLSIFLYIFEQRMVGCLMPRKVVDWGL